MTDSVMDTAADQDHGDLVTRPIWDGLMGEDADGAYLIGGRCTACSFTTLGVRDICPDCWAGGTMAKIPIGRRGTLYTYTVIHQLPAGYDAPFAVGYVDLEDGVRVFAHIETAPDTLQIGAELELTAAPLRKDADGVWLSGPRYCRSAGGTT